jgi:hypothetical protein
MTRPVAIVVALGIAQWRAATGKIALSEAALLAIVNERMAHITPGLWFDTLLPLADARRNWKTGPYTACLRNPSGIADLLAQMGRAIAALSEIYEVAWPSSDLH